jgi:hypothetical protein
MPTIAVEPQRDLLMRTILIGIALGVGCVTSTQNLARQRR